MLLMLPTHVDSLKARRLKILNHALTGLHVLINTELGGVLESKVSWFKGMDGEQNLTQWTMLELAAYMGMPTFAKLLLECGATFTKNIYEKVRLFESSPDYYIQSNMYKSEREVRQDKVRAFLQMQKSSNYK